LPRLQYIFVGRPRWFRYTWQPGLSYRCWIRWRIGSPTRTSRTQRSKGLAYFTAYQ